MCFFYFLVINSLKMCSKCFDNKCRVGDKQVLGKIVLKIKNKKYVWKQLCEVHVKTITHLTVVTVGE